LKKYDEVYNVKGFASQTIENILNGLDEEQRAAVLDESGTSLVIAGPGSGKTKTITHKIAFLVSRGVKPSEILLVTFTRAAATEMILRAQQVSQNELKGMLAGTFHHVCNHLLRRYADFMKLDPNFSILDEEDVKALVKQARNSVVEKDEKFPSPTVLRKIFSLKVNLQTDIEEILVERFPYLYTIADKIKDVGRRYEELKVKLSALDYDDLLDYTNQLLNVKKVREREASRFKWVLVDEFQDTNRVQYEIVEKLSSVHGNLMVVGDDAQSIYSFRGARYENIFDLSHENGIKIYKIQTNYRSSPEIVSLVNVLLPNNVFQKKLRAVKPHSQRPVVVNTWDSYEEAEFVSNKISELINQGVRKEEIAVLYRAHSHSLDVQMELSKFNIPFRVKSGIRFTESTHVKDVLAFLRVVNNPKDELSWKRILQLFTGIGKKGADKVVSFITTQKEPLKSAMEIGKFGRKYEAVEELFKNLIKLSTPSQLIKYVHDTFYSDYLAMTFADFKDRQSDIEKLIEISKRYTNITDFLSDLAITEDVTLTSESKSGSKVTLTTVHQAKGLEWKAVFILSVNPGDFPSFMGIKSGNLDEEWRIFYVAITRAKEYLFICRQSGGAKSAYGGKLMEEEYDFIENIPPSLYESWTIR
jgi:DNA helicase-2/ATP-dependent DNA helicase PcrA